jgi:hypothetical protein
MKPLMTAGRWVATLCCLTFLGACAGGGADAYKLPPPAANSALPGAQATVFRTAASASDAMASVCTTTGGYCALPTGTPAGLRCTCEAKDGTYLYAGQTGEVPAMPEWADPAKKKR